MTYPSDRQKWRVNGAENVCGVIASEVRKATVRLAFMFPHSSTKIHRYRCCNARYLFYFYPYILLITDRYNDGVWTILDAGLKAIFNQNRQSDTQNWYTPCIGNGHYG
ncbi:hypothetical protein [Terasakiella sp. SH-1]|uniref:hypothetical protein n=1 Tax=Terasakiella sp. SH-1 TaxID=2560057 RepID=UPI001073C34A|nr:hypothetical protein [Terasakiella sp. SH-1]